MPFIGKERILDLENQITSLSDTIQLCREELSSMHLEGQNLQTQILDKVDCTIENLNALVKEFYKLHVDFVETAKEELKNEMQQQQKDLEMMKQMIIEQNSQIMALNNISREFGLQHIQKIDQIITGQKSQDENIKHLQENFSSASQTFAQQFIQLDEQMRLLLINTILDCMTLGEK